MYLFIHESPSIGGCAFAVLPLSHALCEATKPPHDIIHSYIFMCVRATVSGYLSHTRLNTYTHAAEWEDVDPLHNVARQMNLYTSFFIVLVHSCVHRTADDYGFFVMAFLLSWREHACLFINVSSFFSLATANDAVGAAASEGIDRAHATNTITHTYTHDMIYENERTGDWNGKWGIQQSILLLQRAADCGAVWLPFQAHDIHFIYIHMNNLFFIRFGSLLLCYDLSHEKRKHIHIV